MSNYLLKYKTKYRLKVELDQNTNDFVRNYDGSLNDNDVYIDCQNGCKILAYGHIDNKKPVWLTAYIPTIVRGHKIIKAIKEKGIEYVDHRETDEEVEFKFKAADIEVVAELMKARTSGASISPFSTKNLPKSNVEIPSDKIALYKEITSVVPKGDLLFIHRVTNDFLENILQKSLRKSDKKFDYKSDMKLLKMGRQVKEFIYTKGMFDEYLEYLKNNLQKM